MPDITYDEDGRPIPVQASGVPPLGQDVPQAPAPAPAYTPAAPRNPEDAELLQAAATATPLPAPVPDAAETSRMVTNLGTNGNATDPTVNFRPKAAPRSAAPNDLTAFDAAKATTDKQAEANTADVTEQAKAHAEADDQSARDTAINSALEAQDRADFNQKWNDNHDKLERHYKEIEDKYLAALDANQHPKDFLTDKSTLQKFGAVFGLVLGSLGGATPGGNAAAEQLNHQMAVEQQRQKDTIEGLDHATLRAMTHISDDNAARQVAQTDLAAQWTATRQHMIDVGTARLKALGQTDAQIAGNVALNDLKAKNAKDKFDVHQDYSKNMSENLLKHAQAAQAGAAARKDDAESLLYRSKASGDIADAKRAKAEEDANNKVLSQLTKDPTYKAITGTAARPGYIPAYQTLHQMELSLKEAASSGDPMKIRAALNNAQESLTKNNIGVAPSKAIFNQYGEFVGAPQEMVQKLSKLVGSPSPSHQEVSGLIEQVGQAANDLAPKIKAAHNTLVNTHLSSGMHEAHLQRNYGTAIAAPFDGVTYTDKSGKEVPAFRNDFNPNTAQPPATQPDLTAMARQALNDPRASAEDKAAASAYLARK